MSEENNPVQPIIIKKIIKGGGGHHGGAWKVAYADFVTAMMAFFLLLWLLSSTTDEQKNGIADYFSPTAASTSTSGGGGVLGGKIITEDEMNRSSTSSFIEIDSTPEGYEPDRPDSAKESMKSDTGTSEADEKTALQDAQNAKAAEEESFKEVEKALKSAIETSPELKDLANNLIVDMTPEGLRIQIVDKESYSMFRSGSSKMLPKTRKLLKMIGKVIQKMPNHIAIAGHTDAHKFSTGSGYTNWELSVDRANASRRAILDTGLPEKRINRIMGKADKENLFENPMDPRNRRISIILLKDSVSGRQPSPLQSIPETERNFTPLPHSTAPPAAVPLAPSPAAPVTAPHASAEPEESAPYAPPPAFAGEHEFR